MKHHEMTMQAEKALTPKTTEELNVHRVLKR